MQCPDLPVNWLHGTNSQKTRFSAHQTSCCQPNSSQAVKKVSDDGIQDQASAQNDGCMFCPPNNAQKTFCSGWCITSCHCNKVIPKWMKFCTTGTLILHEEASFISAERGPRRGISSRTSLKCCIHFSFILKLTIFIHKQKKGLWFLAQSERDQSCKCDVSWRHADLWMNLAPCTSVEFNRMRQFPKMKQAKLRIWFAFFSLVFLFLVFFPHGPCFGLLFLEGKNEADPIVLHFLVLRKNGSDLTNVWSPIPIATHGGQCQCQCYVQNGLNPEPGGKAGE